MLEEERNDNATSNNLVFECAGSQYTVDQEKDEETDGRKRYLSTYIYVYISIFIYCKGITEKDPKAYIPTSNPKCLPVSFCFFSFSQFLHLCPASVSPGQDHLTKQIERV